MSSNRLRNLLIALAAVVLSGAIFWGLQNQANSESLEAQAKQAIPLEMALTNGKPTLTEFYADWCTTCQAMAKDLAAIKRQYAQSVNFVMLNVDNNKWLPEILRYRIDGIPHFLFFNNQGEAIAETIGQQPLAVMMENLNALLANSSLPYAAATGQTSAFKPPVSADNTNPRSHGNEI